MAKSFLLVTNENTLPTMLHKETDNYWETFCGYCCAKPSMQCSNCKIDKKLFEFIVLAWMKK